MLLMLLMLLLLLMLMLMLMLLLLMLLMLMLMLLLLLLLMRCTQSDVAPHVDQSDAMTAAQLLSRSRCHVTCGEKGVFDANCRRNKKGGGKGGRERGRRRC